MVTTRKQSMARPVTADAEEFRAELVRKVAGPGSDRDLGGEATAFQVPALKLVAESVTPSAGLPPLSDAEGEVSAGH